MKRLVVMVLLLLSAAAVHAEQETLLGSHEIQHGGYGGLSLKFTSIDDQFDVLVGGQGGWIINHMLILGAGGWGLVRERETDETFRTYWGAPLKYSMGYGGLIIGVVGGWNRLVHPTFTLLIGGGSVTYFYGDHPDYHWERVTSDEFFVLEPSLGIELNVTTFMRAELSVGYRMVGGVKSYRLVNNDIGGPTGGILLKFGKF